MHARTMVFALIAAVLLGPVPLAATAAAAAQPTRVPSTVLDPRIVLDWDTQRWDREFSALRDAGITDIVLQASADLVGGHVVTYFPTDLGGTVPATSRDGATVDVVDNVLDRAGEAGFTVWIGLLRDQRATRFAPDGSIGGTLEADEASTRGLVGALRGRAEAAGATFAGWYLPAEINTNYASDPARAAIGRYYGQLTAFLHETAPVMIAPYFNASAGVPVSTWRAFWVYLLWIAPVDVIALQDGTGDSPGRPRAPAEVRSTLRAWFGAVRDAIELSGRRTELWAALDLYGFTGATAPIRDVASHWTDLAGIVSGYTSFSFTSNLAPWTLGTSAYFVPFRLWNLTGAVLSRPPSAPGRATAVAHGGRVTIRWKDSLPGPGEYLAFYRIYWLSGDRARYAATSYALHARLRAHGADCVAVIAYDTSGNHSSRSVACTHR